jgi:outer membrane lipoprotein SlyB
LKIHHAFAVTALSAASLLSGCAAPGYNNGGYTQTQAYQAPAYPGNTQTRSISYGTINSIQVISENTRADKNDLIGTVAGGLVGGLLGNQVGGGTGRTVATVAGAVGGAVVGNQIESRTASQQVRQTYQIRVRLENASYETVTQDAIGDLRVGNRVRIENGLVSHR